MGCYVDVDYSFSKLERGGGMSKTKFIVWVGGVMDYEGFDAGMARLTEIYWNEQGYDDVILEIVEV